MGYENREFDRYEPASTALEYIDNMAKAVLGNTAPNKAYTVRDVELDNDGRLTVIERDSSTPLTPDIKYREIKSRQPIPIIDAGDPPGIYGQRAAHLMVSRWLDNDLYSEYRSQIYEPTDTFRPLMNEGIAAGELHFFVPRTVTSEERDRYHPENHQHLTGFALYDFYLEEGELGRAIHYVVPDFRKLFAARREEFCKTVIAYDHDPQQWARDRNIDLCNPNTSDQILFYEIEKAMTLSVVREQSLAEAAFEYLAEESVMCSQEMTSMSHAHPYKEEQWELPRSLLADFIQRITDQA